MAVLAVQAIRRMWGGAQSHLILGDDGNTWVVKFQNNPQHLRVLANEFIVSGLASAAGLTVPECAIIELDPWLAANSTDLQIDFGRGRVERCQPGLHFGSRFLNNAFDFMTEEQLPTVKNFSEFCGVLALDKWTNNCDWRQAVFSRRRGQSSYTASFIDHGLCFNEAKWTFSDAPLKGIYGLSRVYAGVTGWSSFSPWIERLEEMPPEAIWKISEAVPPEWYGGDEDAMGKLISHLIRRRSRIRELISDFRKSDRAPFPNWTIGQSLPRNMAERTYLGKL